MFLKKIKFVFYIILFLLKSPLLPAKQDIIKKILTREEKKIKDLEQKISLFRKESELLKIKNHKKYQKLFEEKEKLELEEKIASLKLRKDFRKLEKENKKIKLEKTLYDAKKTNSYKKILEEKEKLKIEIELAKKRSEKNLFEMRSKTAILKEEVSYLAQKNKQKELSLDLEKLKMEVGEQKRKFLIEEYSAKISLRKVKDDLKSQTKEELKYLEDPFVNGVLSISDRRISLNGPIIHGTANFVSKRIHYFNNLDQKLPIFIVIDYNPGGSVMQGYRILKAIEASKAPIHIVVKSFAASMAAAILTLADKSYAYPNALILHHQPSTWGGGNLFEMREKVKIFQDWAKRLHRPVAQKMGLSLEDFYKKMYENSVGGDWQEFADQAVKLKWVDHLVQEIREEGVRKKPEDRAPRPYSYFAENKNLESSQEKALKDSKEEALQFVKLPRLRPFDFYLIYNPQKYYQW